MGESALHPALALLTEIDEEATIALPLVLWHGHDTGNIVLESRKFLLTEVAHQMAPFLIIAGKDVE